MIIPNVRPRSDCPGHILLFRGRGFKNVEAPLWSHNVPSSFASFLVSWELLMPFITVFVSLIRLTRLVWTRWTVARAWLANVHPDTCVISDAKYQYRKIFHVCHAALLLLEGDCMPMSLRELGVRWRLDRGSRLYHGRHLCSAEWALFRNHDGLRSKCYEGSFLRQAAQRHSSVHFHICRPIAWDC